MNLVNSRTGRSSTLARCIIWKIISCSIHYLNLRFSLPRKHSFVFPTNEREGTQHMLCIDLLFHTRELSIRFDFNLIFCCLHSVNFCIYLEWNQSNFAFPFILSWFCLGVAGGFNDLGKFNFDFKHKIQFFKQGKSWNTREGKPHKSSNLNLWFCKKQHTNRKTKCRRIR